ncbi:MAG: T9SS type A sorting domain-containing protein [Bacteroidaceae bacterium]|nr:T9SS type A sorting domain-containing protein [Bacteroidaceae bacterium]
MKRFVLLLTVLVGALTAQASGGSDYPYLTFETTDGAKASIPVSSLTMTINGNTLTVGDQQFTLTNLAKMYFSTNDETAAGIENVNDNENYTEIYDLQGKRLQVSMADGKSLNGQLPKGVYIVKTKEKTYKMMVR